MKRLRKGAGGAKIRFYMCGEYGNDHARPHFHACLFGYDFEDKIYWKKTGAESKIYRSKELEERWGKGYCSVGDVTFESAAYVARYIMKKMTGREGEKSYERVDKETGEIWKKRSEFNKMSLKPGIGAGWIEKWKDDVYPEGEVVINGKKVRPPKYYDERYKREHPEQHETMIFDRYKVAVDRFEDRTDERLKVREEVTKARIRTLSRQL